MIQSVIARSEGFQTRATWQSLFCSILLTFRIVNFCRDFQKDDYITLCSEMDSRPPLGEAEGLRGNDIYLCLYSCDSALIRVIRDPMFFWLRLCCAVVSCASALNTGFLLHLRAVSFIIGDASAGMIALLKEL